MQRCKTDYGDATPQIRWFIHPLGYAEAARAATPEDRRRKGKSILEVMRNQGVGAVQGSGRIRRLRLRRIRVGPPHGDLRPAALRKIDEDGWCCPTSPTSRRSPGCRADIATYTTLYFDIQQRLRPLRVAVRRAVRPGRRRACGRKPCESLKEDPNGPQIDLREDLIKHLGRRVSVLTDYQLPITTTSERLLFAIEANNPKAVAAAIEKLLKNDPTAKRRDENGHVIWEFVEDESPEPRPRCRRSATSRPLRPCIR